ncbi:metallophosphoesterase family protein [Cesiribacter sp. SM1]|uniref:purple acid phosphatase family protein n=1 Tax=Cesiribacter sp. SM1 TaxID=2861196 RepID=UPI001CD30728|nr:metallophosphoesterase family protein [Cesiribacter sp. SM1]
MRILLNYSICLLAVLVLCLFFTSPAFCQQKEYKRPVYTKSWSEPSVQPDHIILTFSGDPATSQSVTWRTDTTVHHALAEIALANDAPRFWLLAKQQAAKTEKMDARGVKRAERTAHYHSATFTGLLPDTTYAYRVGDGEHWSEWFHFRTASTKAAPFSFLYVGDAQNYILELWSRLIRSGYSKAPDARFIIHAGDLVSDAHSEEQWHEWFTAGGWIHGMVPSVPVPGNHEYEGYTQEAEDRGQDQLSVQWKPQFTLPENGPEGMEETVYTLEYQGLKILALNSVKNREEQTRWMEAELKKNKQKWVIATFHHPVFSASQGRDNEALRKMWKPLFDQHGVDLVLQGHDHSYVRNTTPASATNIVGGVNTRDQTTGTVYVVSVSGGKMYRLKESWEEYGLERDRLAENTQLFQHIQILGDTLRYQAFTAVGDLYDAFDLVKQESGPNLMIDKSHQAIAERRHHNTIPYYDQLPAGAEAKLLKSYPDYKLDKVKYVKNTSFTGFEVALKKGKETLNLLLSEAGEVLK